MLSAIVVIVTFRIMLPRFCLLTKLNLGKMKYTASPRITTRNQSKCCINVPEGKDHFWSRV